MTETNNTNDKPGSAPKATLHLKRPVEQGTVRQSFSHGRTKAVLVEKVKRRIPGAPGEAPTREPISLKPAAPKPVVAPAAAIPAPQAAPSPPKTGVVLRTLTGDEIEARARVLVEARAREEEDRKRQAADAAGRTAREARERTERDAAEARKREEDARRAHDMAVRRQSEDTARVRHLEPDAPRPPVAASAPAPGGPVLSTTAGPPGTVIRRPLSLRPAVGAPTRAPIVSELELRRAKRLTSMPGAKTTTVGPRGQDKVRGRLTVANAEGTEEERTRSVAAFRRRTQRLMKGQYGEEKEKISREIVIPETISIQELANRMSERAVDVIKVLMRQGRMVTLTDTIDADTAQIIAEDLGHTVKRVAESDVEEGLFEPSHEVGEPLARPPVVTIMGHVDHGKTSLLDALRQADVVSGEAGGITQHIGAYQITTPTGSKVTFIDTPGHAAFTAMRARGAKVTDIVVLVVAADDGVMPQTIEAIRHAKEAGAPIIVAVNKIDKHEANPHKVLEELLQYDVQVEAFGGETLAVELSATKKLNLDKLLEAISLQAEVLNLAADPKQNAEGTVIEARLDRGRGPVATVLVQRGTLKNGAIVVAGAVWGRVRALTDDKGALVAEAPPSMPVELLGLSGAPDAGDRFAVVANEARAREITEYRARQKREREIARGGPARTSLADMMTNIKTVGRKDVLLVLKGDVQGSVEAITTALEKLGNDEVGARVIHGGAGGIIESDVTLAAASKAVILGFNVRASKEARDLAARDGVEIRYYNIIYNLIEEVTSAMSGMLAPTRRETMLGNAQILQIFSISKSGQVAGCRVTDGNVQRGAQVRLIRDNVVVHEGKLSTLKRFKDEVAIVQAGQECGMAFENYQDMRVGDVIECFTVEEIKRTL